MLELILDNLAPSNIQHKREVLRFLMVSVSVSCSVLSNSLWLQPHGLLCPWNFLGKNPRVGCHSLLQGVYLTQGLNQGLLHCGWILYHLRYQESPVVSVVNSKWWKDLIIPRPRSNDMIQRQSSSEWLHKPNLINKWNLGTKSPVCIPVNSRTL